MDAINVFKKTFFSFNIYLTYIIDITRLNVKNQNGRNHGNTIIFYIFTKLQNHWENLTRFACIYKK